MGDPTPREGPSDEELRDLLLRDPKSGWPEFWKVFGPLITGRIHAHRLSQMDAQDLVQEISYHLIRNDFQLLRAWDPTRSNLSAYLSVITTSRCVDYLRSSWSNYTRRKVEAAEAPSDSPEGTAPQSSGPTTPADWCRNRELVEALRGCLERLQRAGRLKPLDCRIVELRARGVSFKDIAETLGISENNANTRFSRLRPELRACLARAGIEVGDFS